MITTSDSFTTYDSGKYYTILPQVPGWDLRNFLDHFKPRRVSQGFNYNSADNEHFLSIDEIRGLIRVHLDPTFTI